MSEMKRERVVWVGQLIMIVEKSQLQKYFPLSLEACHVDEDDKIISIFIDSLTSFISILLRCDEISAYEEVLQTF